MSSPKRIVGKSFWPSLLNLARFYMNIGQKGFIVKNLLFIETNWKLIVDYIKNNLQIDIYETINEDQLKEIWDKLRTIFLDWFANANDTGNFKLNLENFYNAHLRKQDWFKLAMKTALPDETFYHIFMNNFKTFWNSLSDGLTNGMVEIQSHRWCDMLSMQKIKEEALKETSTNEGDFEENVKKIEEMLSKYTENADEIQVMVDVYSEVDADEQQCLRDMRNEVSKLSSKAIKVNGQLNASVGKLWTSLEQDEKKLRMKRNRMRTVETLAYITAFIGILLNDFNADPGSAQLAAAIVEASIVPLGSVHADKDAIIRKLYYDVMPKKDRIKPLKDKLEETTKRFDFFDEWVIANSCTNHD